MLRFLLVVSLLSVAAWGPVPVVSTAHAAEPAAERTVADLALTKLDGSELGSEAVKGKVVLFVNVASRCGFTKQYEGLQALYEAHKDDGLVIVGVPCNQFGGQEPGSPEEIQTFCKMNYGVSFPLLEKQEVNGDARSPLYQTLVGSKAGGGSDVGWNFEKFLVGRDGQVLARFPSRVAPDDSELKKAIATALGK